jgi:phosphate transport system substrate-binding protein
MPTPSPALPGCWCRCSRPTRPKGKVIKDLLSWIVTSGESEAAGLSYAPLPKNVAEKVLKTIYSLK